MNIFVPWCSLPVSSKRVKNLINSNPGQRVIIVPSAQANCLFLYCRMNLETPQLLLGVAVINEAKCILLCCFCQESEQARQQGRIKLRNGRLTTKKASLTANLVWLFCPSAGSQIPINTISILFCENSPNLTFRVHIIIFRVHSIPNVCHYNLWLVYFKPTF